MYFRLGAVVSGWEITIFLNFRLGAAVSYCNIDHITEFPDWRGGFVLGYFVWNIDLISEFPAIS